MDSFFLLGPQQHSLKRIHRLHSFSLISTLNHVSALVGYHLLSGLCFLWRIWSHVFIVMIMASDGYGNGNGNHEMGIKKLWLLHLQTTDPSIFVIPHLSNREKKRSRYNNHVEFICRAVH